MASILFICSSIGDTDLAKATADRVLAEGDTVHLYALTSTAQSRLGDWQIDNPQVSRHTPSTLPTQALPDFVKKQAIAHAYVGVPSEDNPTPFELPNHFSIPTTVVYEYMFYPQEHTLWSHTQALASKPNITFAVPTTVAIDDFPAGAKVAVVGHLSIDRGLKRAPKPPSDDGLFHVFAAGTSQADHRVDHAFAQAILEEIATGEHPTVRIQFGLHPGVPHLLEYLQGLLAVCEQHPSLSEQFQIILTDTVVDKLGVNPPINLSSPFFLRENIPGPVAMANADTVGQSVPGALPNECRASGGLAYFHRPVKPYLPGFATSLKGWLKGERPEEGAQKDLAPLTEDVAGQLNALRKK